MVILSTIASQDFIYVVRRFLDRKFLAFFSEGGEQVRGSVSIKRRLLTVDGRLGSKWRLKPELSHRLICDIFSIHDPILATKKMKSKPFNGKSKKIWNVIGQKFIDHSSNSQICASHQNALRI